MVALFYGNCVLNQDAVVSGLLIYRCVREVFRK